MLAQGIGGGIEDQIDGEDWVGSRGAGEFFGRGRNESPGLWFAGALWPTSPLISCEGVGKRHLFFTQLP